MKPYILISNDDGYQAPGIRYLIETLKPLARLIVVAPDGPRSGYACKITTKEPFTLQPISEEDGVDVYACSGSPVDCVKLAFNILLPRLGIRPQLVVSGINHGDNSSVNSFYSGTMGVVTEGTFQGVASIGFSLCDMSAHADFSACGKYIESIVRKVLAEGLPPFTCLNVNFPVAPSFKGSTDAPWTAILPLKHTPKQGKRLQRTIKASECAEWHAAHG